jgi:RND family efflux transporter MFP subunit
MGQALMRLDPTDFAHAVTSQSGTVDAARARLTQAAADEERYRALVSSGAVSQSAYDQVRAAADSARALLAAAEAQLKVARDEGEYSLLSADADGTVVETLAEPGQYVGAGQIVIRLAHSGPREAAVNLPETLRPALGSAAYATLYGSDPRTSPRYAAHLRQLSDAAEPSTRTFEARYVLEGEAAKAPLGATVTIYLQDAPRSSEMTVPSSAIDDEGKGAGIWLIDSRFSKVSFRPIQFVRFDGERAVVTGGVQVGETVVATGGHYLHEGEQVRLATIAASMQ